VAKFYRELWAKMKDVKFEPLQRFATENRVVDDSLVTFEVVRDGCWPHFSNGQKIETRRVHIFEMRDGKISKEIAYGAPHVIVVVSEAGRICDCEVRGRSFAPLRGYSITRRDKADSPGRSKASALGMTQATHH